MTLNLTMPGQPQDDLKPRITVFGVGGAGCNAVNNMIEKQLEGVEFVVANTDAQALQQSSAPARIQMGVKVTEGLGAGARPTVGAAAAEETLEEIIDQLAGAHMCFITAGMGGGTGTGAAPIIAQAARELGVLTVGVVTKPFQFEGSKRMRQAEEGVDALQKVVDTLIIIPNQNLFAVANEQTTFTDAFAMADDVLYQGVKGVTDLMVRPGLINLDFADVRAVMDEMGKAMMGTGEAEGDNRAEEAAHRAINNKLLDEMTLQGAKGVLINVTGGSDMTLFELDEAANVIRNQVDADANIIIGSALDENMGGKMRISVVATGIDAEAVGRSTPVPRRRLSDAPVAAEEAAPAPAPEAAPAGLTITGAAIGGAAVAAPTPTPAPVQAREVAEETPKNLFGDLEAPAAAEADNGMPPPAYTSQEETAVSLEASEEVIEEAPRAASSPNADVLERLRTAVSSNTRAPAEAAPAAAPAPAAQEPGASAAGSRFGLGNLITRMGGAGERAEEAPRAAAAHQPAAQAPQYAEEPEMDSEQERIEIPAFLRRQAN